MERQRTWYSGSPLSPWPQLNRRPLHCASLSNPNPASPLLSALRTPPHLFFPLLFLASYAEGCLTSLPAPAPSNPATRIILKSSSSYISALLADSHQLSSVITGSPLGPGQGWLHGFVTWSDTPVPVCGRVLSLVNTPLSLSWKNFF